MYVRRVRPSHPLLAGYRDRTTVRDPTFPADLIGNYVIDAAAQDALELTVQVASLLRDDDDGLCWMAADVVEPLIDIHWSQIADAFEVAARNSTALRKVISCSSFDDAVPADLQRRLHALVKLAEDIGGRPRPSPGSALTIVRDGPYLSAPPELNASVPKDSSTVLNSPYDPKN